MAANGAVKRGCLDGGVLVSFSKRWQDTWERLSAPNGTWVDLKRRSSHRRDVCEMKYSDGSEARVGDRVRIRNGETGVIVVSIDTGQFSAEYPRGEWEHLKTGVLVRTDKGVLVRFADPLSPGLLERAQT